MDRTASQGCSTLSPHHVPACLSSGEPFAGAPGLAERQQQAMQVASTVGTFPASFLSAMVGAALTSRCSDGWDIPASSDDRPGGDGGRILGDLLGGNGRDD